MASTRIIDSAEASNWDGFVSSQPLRSIYHTRSWAALIEKTFGLKPRYLINTDGAGNISGGMPLFLVDNLFTSKRLTSVPFAHYCNPRKKIKT